MFDHHCTVRSVENSSFPLFVLSLDNVLHEVSRCWLVCCSKRQRTSSVWYRMMSSRFRCSLFCALNTIELTPTVWGRERLFRASSCFSNYLNNTKWKRREGHTTDIHTHTHGSVGKKINNTMEKKDCSGFSFLTLFLVSKQFHWLLSELTETDGTTVQSEMRMHQIAGC